MTFEKDILRYSFDALEPYIDSKTMEIHYTKHHEAYTNNLNQAIKGTSLENVPIEEILSKVSNFSPAVRNNAGGFYNHNLFWAMMTPNGGGEPGGLIGQLIVKEFGSFNDFKEKFSQAAATRFGSGWAWLILSKNKLEIISTPNQDNPLMDLSEVKGFPLLAIDVWEHAYYLKYQNKRPEYIQNFWNVVNWNEVESRYTNALGKK